MEALAPPPQYLCGHMLWISWRGAKIWKKEGEIGKNGKIRLIFQTLGQFLGGGWNFASPSLILLSLQNPGFAYPPPLF